MVLDIIEHEGQIRGYMRNEIAVALTAVIFAVVSLSVGMAWKTSEMPRDYPTIRTVAAVHVG